MADEVNITSICRACKGTGINRHSVDDGDDGREWVEGDCENCGATGRVTAADGLLNADTKVSGDYFDNVINKLGDLEQKINEIKAVVDAL